MRRCAVWAIAILLLAMPRAGAETPAAATEAATDASLSAGCAAGSLAGGYVARVFLPGALTVGGAAVIGGTILAGCAAGAVAHTVTTVTGTFVTPSP